MDFRQAFDIGRGLRHGIEAIKRQPVGLLLGSALLLMTGGGGGGSARMPSGGSGGGGDWGDLSGVSDADIESIKALVAGIGFGVVAAVIGCALLLGIALWLFRSWLQVGYIKLQRDVVVDGAGAVGTLFTGGPQLWPMALWKLLAGVIVIGVTVVSMLPGGLVLATGFVDGGEPSPTLTVLASVLMLVCVVPASIYVRLGVSLGGQAVVLDDCRPLAALDRSWDLVDGHRWHLLWFYVVTWLPNLLGCLAFCVGWIVTAAVRHVAITESYLLATHESTDGFALMMLEPGGAAAPPDPAS